VKSLFTAVHLPNMKKIFSGEGCQIRVMRTDPETKYHGAYCFISTNWLPFMSGTVCKNAELRADWGALEDRAHLIHRDEGDVWNGVTDRDYPITGPVLASAIWNRVHKVSEASVSEASV